MAEEALREEAAREAARKAEAGYRLFRTSTDLLNINVVRNIHHSFFVLIFLFKKKKPLVADVDEDGLVVPFEEEHNTMAALM
ncbi:hypothetical protein GN244_ATG12488 [Phytophthora infestans]|uniref:Uncharacterized protein n=1 Tax=Phytophthora infestans TaxID=4787 RepID=A0A833VZI7_PHYIN|nr:hypothetical protein GN244_ATG12488 [Phytophthora infestans]